VSPAILGCGASDRADVTAATGPAAWLATATAGTGSDGAGWIGLTAAGTAGLDAVAAVGVAMEAIVRGALGKRAAGPGGVGRSGVSAGVTAATLPLMSSLAVAGGVRPTGVAGAATGFIALGCGAVVAAGG
jgi:hypothetical protein